MSESGIAKKIEFLRLIGQLKHIKRTGWVMKGVDGPETIAGHMYRMGIMTFLLEDQHQLDKYRCLQLALVHDMAECIVGDLTPHCGISNTVKHERETQAMKHLASLAGSCGEELCSLFQEYEDQNSPEAKFVKNLDRFDMIMQAFEYEKRDSNPRNLQEFFDSVDGKLTHPLVTDLAKELRKQRIEFETNHKK